MDKIKVIKVVLAVAGAGVSLAAGLLDQKSQEKFIDEKVKEALQNK